jgi:uncharacterized membrane protein
MSSASSSWSGPVRIVLVASLGLNLFFLGWLVGGVFGPAHRGLRPPPPPLPPLHLMADRLRGTMSADGMAKIDALIRDLDTRFVQRISATERSRTRIKELLAAPDFDAAAFASALAEFHAETETDRADVDRRITDVIARLSPDDRRKLADVTLAFRPGDRPGPR